MSVPKNDGEPWTESTTRSGVAGGRYLRELLDKHRGAERHLRLLQDSLSFVFYIFVFRVSR